MRIGNKTTYTFQSAVGRLLAQHKSALPEGAVNALVNDGLKQPAHCTDWQTKRRQAKLRVKARQPHDGKPGVVVVYVQATQPFRHTLVRHTILPA